MADSKATHNIGIANSGAGRKNNQQLFRADDYKIPYHRQYLPVSGNRRTTTQ